MFQPIKTHTDKLTQRVTVVMLSLSVVTCLFCGLYPRYKQTDNYTETRRGGMGYLAVTAQTGG